MIKWLDDIERHELKWVGGKGANLGEMTQIGMPVPPGFCITTLAYDMQMEEWKLKQFLTEWMKEEESTFVHEKVKVLLESAPFHSTLLHEMITAYKKMGEPKVAVRSSATAEDLEDASFAGQQETFLNVQGEEELLTAIRKCWVSLWSPRAIHYREQRQIKHLEVSMAVVIQEMIPAEVAGVAFSVDPITNKKEHMLIEAIHGLGEAIVSGEKGGDIYRVDRGSLEVTTQELEENDRPVLDADGLKELCKKMLLLEEHFGCPQDVEFAFVNQKLFLLQTRPITTIGQVEPEELPPPIQLTSTQKLALTKAAERFPIPPKPLDNLSLNNIIGASIYAYRYLGLDVSHQEEEELLKKTWREAYLLPKPTPTFRLTKLPKKIVQLWKKDWIQWWENEQRPKLISSTQNINVEILTSEELIKKLEEINQAWAEAMQQRVLGTMAMYAAEFFLYEMVALAVGRKQTPMVLANLLSGLETDSTKVNESLWNLASFAKEFPSVVEKIRTGDYAKLDQTQEGKAFLEKFHQLLEEYGHRDGTTWYISTPTWKNNPDQVWRLLTTLVQLETLPSGEGRAVYQKEKEKVTKKLRFWLGLSSFFPWLLERYRHLHIMEENSHLDLTRPLSSLQEIVRECGGRLLREGMIENLDDIYYLKYEELKVWLCSETPTPEEARKLILKRKVTYQVVSDRWSSYLLQTVEAGEELKGNGASHGIARGKARVIRDESEFHLLQPGEILVCLYTNPSWTPLFASAAAVVTETGGVVSHAAIVAREYGIPAVMGVKGVTKLIKDGQEISVDGSEGRVLLM